MIVTSRADISISPVRRAGEIRFVLLLFLLFSLFCKYSNAQDEKPPKWEFGGYVSSLQTALMPGSWDDLLLENTIHNRLNLGYKPWKFLDIHLEVRNRLITGQFFNVYPDYGRIIAEDRGFVDMSDNLLRARTTVLNARIDRVYLAFNFGKTDLTIGRQRINWGQCFAWNPNDIFNTASYFDFDYEEKPGSDAVRLQIYPNATSCVEFAVKADSRDRLTAAALYRFNKWRYDFQFLGGVMNGKELVVGTGWSGNIKNAGFRGEASYFHPMNHFADTSGILVVAIGAEYAFKNSLFLQFEALYNMNASERSAFFVLDPSSDLNAHNLSFTDYNFLVNMNYPLSPLWNLSLAAMYYPDVDGFYAGPGIAYSLSDNAGLSLISQTFGGKFSSNKMEYLSMIFLRFKMNF